MIIMVHNESIIHTTHNNYYDYVYIIIYTVEPPNSGRVGTSDNFRYSEVGP